MNTTPAAWPLASDPVLLGGENRSGTTLLSILLDSHPQLVVGPEIDFPDPPNLGPHILQVCDLMDRGDPRVTGTTKEDIAPEWYDGAHFAVQCERSGLVREELRGLVSELMAELGTDLSTPEDRCRLIEAIGERRRAHTGAGRWGLKLQRKIQDVGAYAAVWPRAHFIHIVRDGRDLAASHLKTVPDWGYHSVAEAAQGWLEVVTRARESAPADRYLEVRYEDLVTRPRESAERMLDHLGLPWDEAVLRHAEYEHALFDKPWGHPAAEAVGKPIHAGRTGRYLHDLTTGEIREFERIAGPELERLGYALTTTGSGGTV